MNEKKFFQFDNSYLSLPDILYSRQQPTPVKAPRLLLFNKKLAEELGLFYQDERDEILALYFSGNQIPEGAMPIAQAYGGHQFGHFNILGDGRALLLGEHVTPSKGERYDVQWKGAGRTAYSRNGDGRAAVGPMLREYIISEAMYHLGIPTTRSLAVVATGEDIIRETPLPGAVLTRIASSHIRIGTFEFLRHKGDLSALKALMDYTLARHFPEIQSHKTPYNESWNCEYQHNVTQHSVTQQSDEQRNESRHREGLPPENQALALLKLVMERQIKLVVHWMRVGFIHGVMNTDNMSISGETIDYGPCAFMDTYDPQTVFSSIDRRGRYRFENQPSIVLWNLARLAESLLPLIHPEESVAIAMASSVLDTFEQQFKTAWLNMMRNKIGLQSVSTLLGEDIKGTRESDSIMTKSTVDSHLDEALIDDLLRIMFENKLDYTNTFYELSRLLPLQVCTPVQSLNELQSILVSWMPRWYQRLSQESTTDEMKLSLMRSQNPSVIPRNHKVEEALSEVHETGKLNKVNQLLEVVADPYGGSTISPDIQNEYQKPPSLSSEPYQTFCGT